MTDPIAKSLTGVTGFDEITGGGLPSGRATLVCGPAGSGKTLFGLEFLAHGGRATGETGVLISFEESPADLAANVASLGIDLPALEAEGLLHIEQVRLDRGHAEVGQYDLEALLIRIGAALQKVGATRLVLDTVDVLFGSLGDPEIVRTELHRFFTWCRSEGLTVIVTAEQESDGSLTRSGVEEYVSDCVVVLAQRVEAGIATRRIRVMKYRGSKHGTNEYPFHMGAHGMVVQPITSVGLDSTAPTDRMSTGSEQLDELLGGGVYRGAAILVSGTPGTGKSTIGAQFVEAACARGERAVYVTHEESKAQIIRNMRSMGIDLGRWSEDGVLEFLSTRPTIYGIELHLEALRDLVERLEPSVLVIDPISSLWRTGSRNDVQSGLIRRIDFLKVREITTLYTAQTSPESMHTEVDMWSLIDTWIKLRNVEADGRYDRQLHIAKSRGSSHSNQVHEFRLSDHGFEVVPRGAAPRRTDRHQPGDD